MGLDAAAQKTKGCVILACEQTDRYDAAGTGCLVLADVGMQAGNEGRCGEATPAAETPISGIRASSSSSYNNSCFLFPALVAYHSKQ